MVESKKIEWTPKTSLKVGITLLIITILALLVYYSETAFSWGWELFVFALLIIVSIIFILYGTLSSQQS